VSPRSVVAFSPSDGSDCTSLRFNRRRFTVGVSPASVWLPLSGGIGNGCDRFSFNCSRLILSSSTDRRRFNRRRLSRDEMVGNTVGESDTLLARPVLAECLPPRCRNDKLAESAARLHLWSVKFSGVDDTKLAVVVTLVSSTMLSLIRGRCKLSSTSEEKLLSADVSKLCLQLSSITASGGSTTAAVNSAPITDANRLLANKSQIQPKRQPVYKQKQEQLR